jgi:hypothetical protein
LIATDHCYHPSNDNGRILYHFSRGSPASAPPLSLNYYRFTPGFTRDKEKGLNLAVCSPLKFHLSLLQVISLKGKFRAIDPKGGNNEELDVLRVLSRKTSNSSINAPPVRITAGRFAWV